MVRIIVVILSSFTLVACEQQNSMESEDDFTKRQEGVIALKKDNEEGFDQVLLIPEISGKDLKPQSEREIIELAKDKSGAYYSIKDEEEFIEIEVGDPAVIYWNGNQSSSLPPQRGAERVELIHSLDD